jgi:hypothetical protein
MFDRSDLGLLSAVLTMVCVVPYLRDVFRGTTRPQRMSWFVFATLAAVAAVSQAAAGAGPGFWLSAGAAIGFSLIFIASIRHGVGGTERFDLATLAVTGVAVVVAFATDQPIVAVGGVVVSELAAVALTVRKVWHQPGSETTSSWAIDALAGLVAIAAIPEFSAVELLYPVHHVIANSAVLLTIAASRRHPVGVNESRPS